MNLSDNTIQNRGKILQEENKFMKKNTLNTDFDDFDVAEDLWDTLGKK